MQLMVLDGPKVTCKAAWWKLSSYKLDPMLAFYIKSSQSVYAIIKCAEFTVMT